jgi:hypothetical protein
MEILLHALAIFMYDSLLHKIPLPWTPEVHSRAFLYVKENSKKDFWV